MTFIRSFCFIFFGVCMFSPLRAQHPLDRFLGQAPVKTEIGSMTDGLNNPVDLDFCRVPGRTDELWVLNREMGSSSMSIFFHAGTTGQKSQYRKDSHSDHFMVYSSAMAMAANGNFGTTQEVLNSVGGTISTFMGPVLWMSDTSVFARMYQSNWDAGKPLGSHIDMLHESPYSMGIASEKDNVYWVFDGYFGNLVRYDFATPHVIGGDDHSDGRVWRYPQVKLERIPDLPAHMVFDEASGWLYIVDNSNAHIIRVNTKTGVKAKDLPQENEELVQYWEMKDVVQEVYIDTGLTAPVGIDLWNGRLVVTDAANGQIRLYDATGSKGTYLGSINTGANMIMGVKIGPDSNIWYVDANDNTVTRLSVVPTEVKTPAVPVLISPVDLSTVDVGQALIVSLQWASSENATYYQVQVATTNDFSTIVFNVDSTTALTELFKNVTPDVTYYWHVRAFNELTNSNWSTAWSFTTQSLSVHEYEHAFNVSMYPNPMRSAVTITCDLPVASVIRYELVNMLGIPVRSGSSAENTFTLDRNGLTSGSYLLKLSAGDLEVRKMLQILD